MKNVLTIFLILIFLLINLSTVSTQEEHSGLINALKTPKGMIMIYNKGMNNFKFEIECAEAIPFDAESMAFLIDKRFFQLVIVPLNEVIKKSGKDMTDLDILAAHKNFEMDYIYEVAGMNFDTKTDTIHSDNNRKFLYWELNIKLTPEDTASDIIKTKMYLNTLLNDEILSLSMAVTINDNPAAAKKLMMNIAQNFAHSKNPYNVEQISDSLRSLR